MFTDRMLKCADCGVEFLFSTAEQQFWEERGFRSPPRRCRDCRRKRRDAGHHGGDGSGHHGGDGAGHHAGDGAGSDGQRSPSAGGGDRPRGDSRGGGGSTAPRESHPATCSACGAETTVPFKPDPARATFCRACYAQRRKT